MGNRNPVIALAKHTDGPAARADGHLHRVPALQPALSPAGHALVDALIIPGRVGPLPPNAAAVAEADIVNTVAAAGLVTTLRANAAEAGLESLSEACAAATTRQRFIGRERWHTARVAAERIQSATDRPPTALGSLAAMHLVYPTPASRLRGDILFLVPSQCAAKARLAVADLLGVDVTAHIIPGNSPRSWDEAVRLRGSALVEEGWQLPTLEDAALLTLPILETHQGPRAIAALADLVLLTRDPHFHWETFAQRAAMWRLRPAAWAALLSIRERFGCHTPASTLRRLEPTPWERILRSVLG
jgi:hypothetical protein